MKKTLILLPLFLFALFGCSRTWKYTPIEEFKPQGAVAPATTCENCHKSQYDAWKDTRHSSEKHMAVIPVVELRECQACHSDASAHSQEPTNKVPADITKLSKTEQNNICGKCHYNKDIFGLHAINPQDKHALFMSVGFEGHKKQLSCLDCHSGHHGGSEMLKSAKPHVCFDCHKEAIVTMGVFQPVNYVAYGKACQACHAVHGGSSTAQWTRMGVGFCVVCHFVGVAVTN
jgi:predicted CXXCH cytochrome family protein